LHFFIIEPGLKILLYLAMVEEEERNIEKFGHVYKNYMQRVLRINLLAGTIRRYIRNSQESKSIKQWLQSILNTL